jgi:hypothetical protein
VALLNVTGVWTGAACQSTANFNAGSPGELDIPERDLQDDKVVEPFLAIGVTCGEDDWGVVAREIFGDLLEIRRTGVWWWSLRLTLDLALWRGLEQIMLDMIERPGLVHRPMGIQRDGTLPKLDRAGLNRRRRTPAARAGRTPP